MKGGVNREEARNAKGHKIDEYIDKNGVDAPCRIGKGVFSRHVEAMGIGTLAMLSEARNMLTYNILA